MIAAFVRPDSEERDSSVIKSAVRLSVPHRFWSLAHPEGDSDSLSLSCGTEAV